MQFNFRVEKLKMLDEWTKFVVDTPLLTVINGDTFAVSSQVFHKMAYFVYFFGSFYKHNGDKNDEKFVQACYYYIGKYINFRDGEEFDLTDLFNKGFL